MNDYKELEVWKKAVNLVTNIYELCKILPKEELYSLSDQIKRCAISIPANIAEGSGRNTSKEFIRFLYISLGSAYELETHLIIGENIGYFSKINSFLEELNDIKKMLNGLINSIKRKGSRWKKMSYHYHNPLSLKTKLL